MNGIFECSVASTRAEATAFTLDGGDCQPGSVTPDVEYESSLTDIMVFVETDSSGVVDISKFLCLTDFESNKFIQAPTCGMKPTMSLDPHGYDGNDWDLSAKNALTDNQVDTYRVVQ